MIKEHETFKIIDSSKIEEYITCPRKYFYRYILGWRPDTTDTHLHFGTCWHLAMEYLLTHGYDYQSVIEAYSLFEETYRQEFSEVTDSERFPKTPAVALKALAAYASSWAGNDAGFKVLHTEIAGSVSVSKGRNVHFKMDSILQDEDAKFFSLEHKTGSTNNRQWSDKWKLSIQVGTYSHVLYCLYPQNDVWGVRINGTFFRKGRGGAGDVELLRVPIRKTPESMEDWLQTVEYWLDKLEEDMNKLQSCSNKYTVMPAFAKNPSSCTQYFGCQYIDFCIAWANPLIYAHEVPLGFRVEYWNPHDAELTAKKIVHV